MSGSAAATAANGSWADPDRFESDKRVLRAAVASRRTRDKVPERLLPAYDLGMEMVEENRRNTQFSIILIVAFAAIASVFMAWFFERMGRMRALRCGRTLAQSVAENTAAMLGSVLRGNPMPKDGVIKPDRDAVLESVLSGIETRGAFAQEGGVSLVLVVSTDDDKVYADSVEPVAAKNSVTGLRPGTSWGDRKDVEGNRIVDTLKNRAAAGGGFVTMRVRVASSSIEEEEASTFFVQPVPNAPLMVVALAPATKDVAAAKASKAASQTKK